MTCISTISYMTKEKFFLWRCLYWSAWWVLVAYILQSQITEWNVSMISTFFSEWKRHQWRSSFGWMVSCSAFAFQTMFSERTLASTLAFQCGDIIILRNTSKIQSYTRNTLRKHKGRQFISLRSKNKVSLAPCKRIKRRFGDFSLSIWLSSGPWISIRATICIVYRFQDFSLLSSMCHWECLWFLIVGIYTMAENYLILSISMAEYQENTSLFNTEVFHCIPD